LVFPALWDPLRLETGDLGLDFAIRGRLPVSIKSRRCRWLRLLRHRKVLHSKVPRIPGKPCSAFAANRKGKVELKAIGDLFRGSSSPSRLLQFLRSTKATTAALKAFGGGRCE
jgi:hypothetical protein